MRDAVRGALFNSLANYGMSFFSFFYWIVMLMLITPEDRGLFTLGLALMLGFARVKLWGLNALIIADQDPDDLQISTQFWLSVGLSSAVPLLVLLGWPLLRALDLFTPQQMLMALLLAVFAIFENEGIASTPESLLARDLRYDVLAGLNLTAELARMLISLGVAALYPSAWALLVGYAVRAVIYCAGVWRFAPRRPKLLFSLGRARLLIKQGAKLLWGGIGTYLAYQYDDIVVGIVSGQGPVGHYGQAYVWSQYPMSIVGGILGVTAPTYARARSSRQTLTEAVTAVFDVIALVALPASFGLAVIAPEFVATFFGPEWLPTVPMVQILLLYSLFRPLNDSIGSLAPALDRNEVHRRYGIVQSITMLVLATSLVLLFERAAPGAGANGAALAAGLTVVVGFGVLYHGLLRDTVDVAYLRVFAPTLAGALLSSAGALFVAAWWTALPVWGILVQKMVVFSLIYAGFLLLVDRRRVLQRADQIRNSLRRQPEG